MMMAINHVIYVDELRLQYIFVVVVTGPLE